MKKLKTIAIKKRFEKLVSLNIEGVASSEDNLELWKILRQHSNLKADFIQTRNIHYLLKVGCDPSASETAFANRFRTASRTSGLSEKDLLASVQNRLVGVVQKKRKFAYPALKIAASVLIILGCAVLCKSLFLQPQKRLHEISRSDEIYLTWNFEPQIAGLKKSITMVYGPATPKTCLYTGSQNVIVKKRENIIEMINRSEKLWP